ncbi:hypothetical protein ACFPZ0_21375 [Streptomonospora nanhaiensis]|uniref:DUF4352 domain-containing protein n=1 Tax=Streptomonospora nanhaiensis TaxID=1323731 RepID=A0A853BR42_9ACTN|nr:hypothetical protein [Streptomonospora nanhaiensis]MBV2364320.1 DUF4352 domain-containing protein [Streptomonospora nanhaiensis]MBX9390576.1 DUF4352 domain-containing protein [Streptomonospora nanhaiensis]NYI97205.1 hypothetical protein [Streptomonospora nanhaiensis]
MATALPRRALTVASCAVLLVLIFVAQSMLPGETDDTEPIAFSGEVGTEVDADQFTITASEARIAASVQDEGGLGGGAALKPHGVWVVVPARITSQHAPLGTVEARLAMGDGYTYSVTSWLYNGLGTGSGPTLSPGISVGGAFVFEVPKDRLVDPVLQVSARESLDARLSARADIDLGLGEDEIAEMTASPEESISIPAPAQIP